MMAFNVFAITLGMVVALGPFAIEILYPGSDFGVATIFAVIASAISGYLYMVLSIAMPRSGGDYVYLSYTVHPAVGFMVAGGFVAGTFYWIALTSSWCVQSIGYLYQELGLSTGNIALLQTGNSLISPTTVFVGGTIAVIVAAILIILGTRFLRRFFIAMFAVGMAGSVVLLVLLLSVSHSQFVQNFNGLMLPYTGLPDTYNGIISAARDAGFSIVAPSLLMSFMALPYAQWTFLGFQYSVYMGGEIKTPTKSQPLAIFGGLLIDFVIVYASAVAFVNIAGKDFVASMAFLGGVFQGLPVPNLINSYVPAVTNNVYLIGLIGISLFAWSFMVMLTGFMVATRMIFGFAFNRVAPEAMASVSRRFRSPWVATIFMGIGGIVFLGITAFTAFSQFILNYIVIFIVVFLIGGLAPIVLPYTKKDLFEASPNIVKKKIAGIPIIVIVGIVNLFFFGFMLYSSLVNPSYYGITYLVVLFDAVCFIIPLGIYYVAKAYRNRQGMNIDLLWKEIPPE
jgi:APA family basic amino acid/polyamine antiporter